MRQFDIFSKGNPNFTVFDHCSNDDIHSTVSLAHNQSEGTALGEVAALLLLRGGKSDQMQMRK